MLGILKVKMSLEYPTFETTFESGLNLPWLSIIFQINQIKVYI